MVIIDFLISYWREILSVCSLVGSIVILCVKKKPVKVIDGIKDTILQSLPGYVSKAEEKYGIGHGPEKLQFVVNSIMKDLSSIDSSIDVVFYTGLIVDQVEKILSTPQKK